MRLFRLASALFCAGLFGGCGGSMSSTSHLDVSEIPTTGIEQQAVSNCWAYAITAWIETQHLQATQRPLDLSETYLTYWRLYEGLQTYYGGEFPLGEHLVNALQLVRKVGVLQESDFVALDGLDTSSREKRAIEYIKRQLGPGGRLSMPQYRQPQNIMAELNNAFAVDMQQVMAKAMRPEHIQINSRGDSLAQLITGSALKEERNPALVYSHLPPAQLYPHALNLFRRIQRAVNDHVPVMITFNAALPAIDPRTKAFRYDFLRYPVPRNDVGGHTVIIVDYVVDNVPGIGTIGEGEVDATLKEKALEGQLRYFKIKNSWGENPRQPGGLAGGFYRINLDYLVNFFRADDGQLHPGFESVILPAGY